MLQACHLTYQQSRHVNNTALILRIILHQFSSPVYKNSFLSPRHVTFFYPSSIYQNARKA